MEQIYKVSFRTEYPDGGTSTHRQPLTLAEIPKWLECYRFTHPRVKSISVKVWFEREEESE